MVSNRPHISASRLTAHHPYRRSERGERTILGRITKRGNRYLRCCSYKAPAPFCFDPRGGRRRIILLNVLLALERGVGGCKRLLCSERNGSEIAVRRGGRPAWRLAMKSLRALAFLSACSTLAIDARPSGAEIYRPWCAGYPPTGSICAFNSFEQCMMTAGPGTGASCYQNPWYLYYGPGSNGSARQRARRR